MGQVESVPGIDSSNEGSTFTRRQACILIASGVWGGVLAISAVKDLATSIHLPRKQAESEYPYPVPEKVYQDAKKSLTASDQNILDLANSGRSNEIPLAVEDPQRLEWQAAVLKYKQDKAETGPIRTNRALVLYLSHGIVDMIAALLSVVPIWIYAESHDLSKPKAESA